MNAFEYFQDPGHGWIAVPVENLVELGIADKISGYSYLKDGMAYLEEDMDATTFIHAMSEHGLELKRDYVLIDRYIGGHNPIRNYKRYKYEETAA